MRYLYKDGKEYTRKEACEAFGIKRRTLDRHMQTLSFIEAVDASLKHQHRDLRTYTDGKSCRQLEKEHGLTEHSLAKYLRAHPEISLSDAILDLKESQRGKRTVYTKEQKQMVLEDGSIKEIRVTDYALSLQCSKMTLYKYLKMGYNLTEASNIIKANQRKGFPGNTAFYYDENTSLYRYCLDQGYNYSSIYGRIVQGSSIPLAIKSYVEAGQGRPKHWKHEYHGVLLSSILRRYGIDYAFVFHEVNNGSTLDEAIEKYVFRSTSSHDVKEKKIMLELYRLLETYPSKERYRLLNKSTLGNDQKIFLEEKYNELSIVKRDLTLLALYQIGESLPEEEKENYALENDFTSFEKEYVQKVLMEGLELSVNQGKKRYRELTRPAILYYNKPSKGNLQK